jgi:hypothetical protein
MIGTVVNTALVIIGSLLGLIFKSGIPENIKKIIMIALGLFTCILGIRMGLEMKQPLIVLLSLVIGGAIGELVKIENSIENVGTKLKTLVKTQDETTFAQGFVTASILFCAGPMTILGCIQAGLQDNPQLLFIKSLMDGVSAIILTSLLGIGVIFSALTVLIFQGLLTILAQQLNFLSATTYLNDFTSVGGIIILAIGIKLLGIKEIKAGNFLPALIFVILFIFVSNIL